MAVVRTGRRYSVKRIEAATRRLLDASTLCAISTSTRDSRPHINTAYFAWTGTYEIVWMSAVSAAHSHNLASNPRSAIAVYDSRQRWGGADRGIQLFGSATELKGAAVRSARLAYTRRFPRFAQADLGALRLYRFRPRRLKLFDERAFGGGTFVTVEVSARGRLAWSHTEVYR